MRRLALALIVAGAALAPAFSQDRANNQPPKGFTAMFNGKDLSGWRGRQPNFDPAAEAAMAQDEHAAKQAEWNAERPALEGRYGERRDCFGRT